MNNGALVRLIDVHKVYRTGEMEVPAVRGVSLEIKRGEFVALMGASGSGKSTLMNILGCLDRPIHGQLLPGWCRCFRIWIAISSPIFGIARSVSSFRILICCHALRRERTSELPLGLQHAASDTRSSFAKRRIASLHPSDSQVARIIIRASFRAASNSAWRLRAR